MRNIHQGFAVLLLITTLFSGCQKKANTGGDAPASRSAAKPYTIVLPNDAGTSMDLAVRYIVSKMELDVPVKVLNVSGGGTSVGTRRVADSSPDDRTLLVTHESTYVISILDRLGYNMLDKLDPVAATGGITPFMTIRPDAPYSTLGELAEYAKDNDVKVAAQIGTQGHLMALLAQELLGVEFTIIQVPGGGPGAHTALLGGHVDMADFGVAVIKSSYPAGKVQLMAFKSPKRDVTYPEIPTTYEQGYEIDNSLNFIWWIPKGAADSDISPLVSELERVAGATDFQDELLKMGLTFADFRKGDELKEYTQARYKIFEDLVAKYYTDEMKAGN